MKVVRFLTVLMFVFALIATAIPFVLWVDSLNVLLPSNQNDSALIRSIVARQLLLSKELSSLTDEETARKAKYSINLVACHSAVMAVDRANVVLKIRPDCVSFVYGDTDDAGLKATSMAAANRAIDSLKEEHDRIQDLAREIAVTREKRAEAEMNYSTATVGAVQARYSQLELFLVLMRYGSFGAIGAIGFNIVLRLGVFTRLQAPNDTHPTLVEVIYYLIGSMMVAAILAVILVPRFTNIADANVSYVLTAEGISFALAAGLVGDIALHALRAIALKFSAN